MEKIPTLFTRDFTTRARTVTNDVTPGCEWVIAGEGIATHKYDGVNVKIEGGMPFRRHEVKPGKTAPDNWVATGPVDETTGKQQGYVPLTDGPTDKHFWEAVANARAAAEANRQTLADGTYEAMGPKFQGNTENYPTHTLVSHDTAITYPDCPRNYEALRKWLVALGSEGVVWHHPNGAMVKLKARDFPKD